MASLQLGGRGRHKPVDLELPLVPFIDLLLCTVMFLLISATWSQMAQLHTAMSCSDCLPTSDESTDIVVTIGATGFVVGSPAGARVEIPRQSGALDYAGLRDALGAMARSNVSPPALLVAPDDGIVYDDLVKTMDTGISAGFANVSVRG